MGYFLCRRQQRQSANVNAYRMLEAHSMPREPSSLLQAWLSEAEAVDGISARFMVLATSSAKEGATARNVLLQRITPSGELMFGSSNDSLKDRQLKEDSRAEIVFRWGQRQVRVRGTIQQGTVEQTKASWDGLPAGPRRGLARLNQGQPVDERVYNAVRAEVESECLSAKHASIPLCPHDRYRAFLLAPTSIEFYSGGHVGMVNDRFLFVRRAQEWERMRLQA